MVPVQTHMIYSIFCLSFSSVWYGPDKMKKSTTILVLHKSGYSVTSWNAEIKF